jgi:hypothetical protein
MKPLFRITLTALVLSALNACATWGGAALQPGLPEQEVITHLGKPTHVYQDGNSRMLEYMHGPMGQTTEMARIGPDGKLVSYEQVLTMQHFAKLKLNESRESDVLRTVGAPSETKFYSRIGLISWNYPYKESGVWDSEMSVYFDGQGIVRRLENGPDPRRLPSDGGRN